MRDEQPKPSEADAVSLHINPYTASEHGWRGLSLPGNRKRKWYTVLRNEQVLVTALLTGIPGEYGARHSHESGELSIHFTDELRPQVTWNPPGVLHGGRPEPQPAPMESIAQSLEQRAAALRSGDATVAQLASMLVELQQQMAELQAQLQEALRPSPAPRVIIDILFPPFRTTVDDPDLPEKKVVVGQWYD
jgi:hypothetical protein